MNIEGSSNGRTKDFESFNRGSTPCPSAMFLLRETLIKQLEKKLYDAEWIENKQLINSLKHSINEHKVMISYGEHYEIPF